MDTSFATHFGAVELGKALSPLVGSENLRNRLSAEFGPDKADSMTDMMRQGVLSGDVGAELHDFFGDAILNGSEIAWSGLIKRDRDDYLYAEAAVR